MRGRKTDILDVVCRKLAPFVMLFGFYLITYGHLSPGGGFQGGVVIASGVILLALGRGSDVAERLFPVARLHRLEAVAFAGLIALSAGAGLLMRDGTPPRPVTVIFVLNVVIGFKVAAGISLICLKLFEEERP